LPWSAQLNEISGAILGARRGGTGTERFGPVVAGEPTPDCGLVTDITLRACAGICPGWPSGWKYLRAASGQIPRKGEWLLLFWSGREPSCWYSDPEPTMPVARHRGDRRTNQPGRPRPNPRAPSRRRRSLMELTRQPCAPVERAAAVPARKVLGPFAATGPTDAQGQRHL